MGEYKGCQNIKRHQDEQVNSSTQYSPCSLC